MHINFTKDAPYKVMSEDLWDYHADPPLRYKIFEADNYFEAVSYAMEYYDKCDESELKYPWLTSLWITPEPIGMHFDYHKYIEYLLPQENTTT
jgi:hypothetical protein